MTQPILLLVAVLAVTTTVVNVNADDTIFSQLFPTACVNPLLNSAGFCTLNAGCTEKCFGSVAAAELGVPSGFYFPVDAVECNEFEDPICPTTSVSLFVVFSFAAVPVSRYNVLVDLHHYLHCLLDRTLKLYSCSIASNSVVLSAEMNYRHCINV